MADEPTRMSPFGGGDTNALLSQISLLLGRLKDLTGSDREVKRALEKFFSSGGRPTHGDMTQDTRFSDQLRAQQERLSVTLRKMNDDLVETEAKLRSNDVTETQKKMLREEIRLKQETIDRERQYKKKIDDAAKELDEFNKQRQTVMRKKDSGAITEEQSERYLSIIDRKESEKVTELKALLDAVRTNIDNQNAQAERRLDTLDHTFRSYADTQEKMKDFLGNQMTAEEAFEKEKDRILTALAQQLQSVTEKIKEIDRQLDEDNALTDEQRKNLEKERENLSAQQTELQKQNKEVHDATKRSVDATKKWEQVGEDLKSIPSNIMNGLMKATVFDRLNGILTEGFDKVYQSVEKTRNEISARSRLDAGGYKELQDQIQDMIKQEGLEGVVNQVDINDAITQLSAAGITDEGLLRDLGVMQAKLIASGSSLDLTNEGALNETLALLKRGYSVKDIEDTLIKSYRGAELAEREKYGYSFATERGGGSRLYEQTAAQMNMLGQDLATGSDNLTAAIATSAELSSYNIDPTLFQNILNGVLDKTISEQSPFGQVLAQQKVTAEGLKTMSNAEALQKIAETYMIFLKDSNKDTVKYLMQAIGAEGSTSDIYRLQEAIQNGTLDLSSLVDMTATQKQNEKLLDDFNNDLKSGKYESKTQKETNKQMNMITETATTMEQFYNGDKLYHSVTDPLLGGIEQIISTIILTRSIQNPFGGTGGTGGINPSISGGAGGVGGATGGATGGAGGGVGGATGGGMWSGALGKGASTTVKGLGVGVGSVMAGVTLATDILEADTWQEGLYNATEDPTFWSGIGTAAGSAIAGPLGAAVGGAIGNIIGPFVKTSRQALDKLGDAMIANSDAADAMKAIDERNAAQEEAMAASSKYLSDAAEELRSASDTLTSDEQSKLDVLDVLSKSSAFADVATSQYGAKDLLYAGDITRSELPSDWFQQLLDSGLYDLEPNELDNDPKKIQEYAMQYFSAKKLMNASGMEAVNAIQQYVDAHEGMTYAQAISNIYGDSIGEEQASNIVATLETMAKTKESYAKAQEKFKDKWESIVADNQGKTTEELISIYSDTYGKDLASALQYSGDNLVMENGIPKLKYAKSDGTETYNPEYYAGKFKAGMTRIPFDEYPALLHEGERILTAKEATAYNDLSSYAVESLSNSINNTDSSEIEQVFTNSIISGNEQMNDSIETQTETLSTKLDAILIAMNDLVKAIRVSSSSTGSNLSNVLKMNSNITQMNTTI